MINYEKGKLKITKEMEKYMQDITDAFDEGDIEEKKLHQQEIEAMTNCVLDTEFGGK